MRSLPPPPRLAVLESLGLFARVRLFTSMLLAALIYAWKFRRLQRLLEPGETFPARADVRALQLQRRFIAGAAAGYVASTQALQQPFFARTNFIHADVCAYWSNCLIAADATMDEEALSLPEVRRLFGESYAAMSRQIEPDLPIDVRRRLAFRSAALFGADVADGGRPPTDPGSRLRRYTLHTAAVIGDRVSRLACLHGVPALASALEQFYSRTLDLMAAQLETYDQSIVDDAHDFNWYRSLMHRKFMNVLLVPIALFADPAAGLYPEEPMRLAFHLLNRNFLHRQILDDLIDFDEDVANHVANTLIYVLVSQGHLASLVAGDARGADEASLMHALNRSGLLNHPADGFDDGVLPPVDRGPDGVAPDVASLVHHALENGPDDAALPLGDLAGVCLRRRAALYEAWGAHRHAAVKEIVTQSRVAERFLDAIASGAEQRGIEDALKRCMERSNIQGFVYAYYARTLRTYEKCVKRWRPRAAPVARPGHESA